MKYRILIADDHEIFRSGVRAILSRQPDMDVVGEAFTGLEAVEFARTLKPDLIIMDIAMPDLNGLEAARQILKERPTVEVLVLTMHDSEELVREVLDAGARGYMLKSDAGRDLLTAVDSLRRHKPYFTSKVSDIVLDRFLGRGQRKDEPEDAQRSRLTSRERQIVQLLVEGKSNKEVAGVLGIAPKTVETHRGRIMAKLNLKSFSELVRWAIRNRITEA